MAPMGLRRHRFGESSSSSVFLSDPRRHAEEMKEFATTQFHTITFWRICFGRSAMCESSRGRQRAEEKKKRGGREEALEGEVWADVGINSMFADETRQRQDYCSGGRLE